MSQPTSRIAIGVSSCLLGEEVRYDGGHRRDAYVADTLADAFDLVGVCPEAELGLGVPRETIDLVGDPMAPRLLATNTGTDWTGPMSRWSRRRVRELGAAELCGYVFKRNSPSCGVFRVPVQPTRRPGRIRRQGRGFFAAEFNRRQPLVPLEEEGRLRDPRVRDNFIVRVFALHRLRQVFGGRWRRTDVLEFHRCETALLQAHDPHALTQLDLLLAASSRKVVRQAYPSAFMAILARNTTPHKQARVLRHLLGLLPREVPAQERKLLRQTIADFKQGLVPWLTPVSLLRHHGRLHDIPALRDASFLNPDPTELDLRCHA